MTSTYRMTISSLGPEAGSISFFINEDLPGLGSARYRGTRGVEMDKTSLLCHLPSPDQDGGGDNDGSGVITIDLSVCEQ